jgi:hypothetical protein
MSLLAIWRVRATRYCRTSTVLQDIYGTVGHLRYCRTTVLCLGLQCCARAVQLNWWWCIRVSGIRYWWQVPILRYWWQVSILTKLQHPHVIGYYGTFLHKHAMHLLMDYCDGGTLEDVTQAAVKEQKALSHQEIMAWTCQLVLALQYLHTLGHPILHRDIKQANVFLIGRAWVKLGDFGLARTLSSESSLAQTACGTPFYLSPELCMGDGYDEKSDCWSLGCLVYELMMLHRPFQVTQCLHACGGSIKLCLLSL